MSIELSNKTYGDFLSVNSIEEALSHPELTHLSFSPRDIDGIHSCYYTLFSSSNFSTQLIRLRRKLNEKRKLLPSFCVLLET